MNRTTTAMLAALEALVVVCIGIGIALVPLTVLWAAQFHLAVDWLQFWRAASDIWLVGNGVNLTVVLDHATATALALPGADVPFQVTIAILGFALLSMLLGVRTGMRAAQSPFTSVGVVSAIVSYGILATLITISAGASAVRPSIWQGVLYPMLIYAGGVAIGTAIGRARRGDVHADGAGGALRQRWSRFGPSARAGIVWALRSGTAAAGTVMAAAAVVVAIMILVDYGTIVGLYEGLQGGALGGAVLTIAQLAFLPNLVIWAASWLIGPGFAIGAGSSVSPIGTQLGPIPSLPLFGALPHGQLAFGFLGLIIPILAGFLVASATRTRLSRTPALRPGGGWLVLVGLGIGVVAGIELGLLAWWSSGALGPGRLHETGPNPWLVGAVAAAEIAGAAVIGIYAGGRRSRE